VDVDPLEGRPLKEGTRLHLKKGGGSKGASLREGKEEPQVAPGLGEIGGTSALCILLKRDVREDGGK